MNKIILFTLLMFIPFLGLAAEKSAISGLRIADREGFTRLVFDADDSVDFQLGKLAEPERISVTVKNVLFTAPLAGQKFSSRLVEALRVNKSGGDISVSVSLKTKVKIVDSFIILPSESSNFYRLVIDFAPEEANFYGKNKSAMIALASQNEKQNLSEGPDKQIKKAKENFPLPIANPNRVLGKKEESLREKNLVKKSEAAQKISGLKEIPLPSPKPKRPVIVIDAGHGGNDPGAISKSGLKEKNITLNYAKQLRQYLNRSGYYDIIMTRDDDYFMSLRKRVSLAKKFKADLFISLHADSHPDSNVKGLSVYTVSEKASDMEAEKLADSANKSEALAKLDLTKTRDEAADVLIELVKRETMNNSARFAEIAVNELGSEAKLLKNTHRFAGFVVLTGIDVPSALVELGYLSNAIEEEKLKKPEYREKLIIALAESIDKYFNKSYDYSAALKEEIYRQVNKPERN